MCKYITVGKAAMDPNVGKVCKYIAVRKAAMDPILMSKYWKFLRGNCSTPCPIFTPDCSS